MTYYIYQERIFAEDYDVGHKILSFTTWSRSLKKRIAARTSPARFIRQNLGLKAPRGWGWLTNPRKAAYNRVYNRTTVGCATLLLGLLAVATLLAGLA